jgi:hypothetical protein
VDSNVLVLNIVRDLFNEAWPNDKSGDHDGSLKLFLLNLAHPSV